MAKLKAIAADAACYFFRHGRNCPLEYTRNASEMLIGRTVAGPSNVNGERVLIVTAAVHCPSAVSVLAGPATSRAVAEQLIKSSQINHREFGSIATARHELR